MDAVASLAPFVLIALLFWLLLIRPAQRRQREAAATQRAASIGSDVMLTSGLYGTVTGADDETLQLEISPGTTVKVARGAVARVLSEPSEPAEQPEPSAPASNDPEDQ